MAITIGNVQNVKFLRNNALYATYEQAYGALTEYATTLGSDSIIDGTSVLARYGSGGDVKTLVGYLYNDGTYSSITIFDIEGAEADVQELREEINAKLGTGITSGNTVTMQLEALSGNTFTPGTSSSADTSVEGAKAYAKDYTDEQIGELEYTGVTTGTGVYVTNVTEVDGVVSATTATLPTVAAISEAGKPIIAVSEDKGTISASAGTIEAQYVNITDSGEKFTATTVEDALAEVKDAIGTAISGLDKSDSAVAKKFVTSVSEEDGIITVSRGEVTSSGQTIVLTDNSDGGVNFEVHYDGTTIIQDPTTKELKVASSALVQYKGDEDTIHISDVVGDTKTVSSLLTIQKVTSGLSEEVKEEYHLVGASGTTIGDPVKIYKDSHIVSIDYIDDPADEHYQNLKYVYVNASGVTSTTYVDMSELVLEAEFASGLTIENHVARGVVDPASELDESNVAFLTVGADGFKVSGIKDAIDTKINKLDADVSGNSTHVTVGVEEVDGKISAVTVSENNIANADDLATLSAKTITEISSTNSSIGISTANTADGTVEVDVITDASKIKMTGFTADASGFTAITSASTVTEAVKAIETEVLANEQTTAAALNDLDGRLDKVEDEYISGITVNGSGLTVSGNVAAVTIQSSQSATTATNNEAITVQTDANGNIILGIATLDCGTY